MPISFTNDQRVAIPAEEYWQHQNALNEHSLIGREALSRSEIRYRIEVLKRFESVGIMSAGEIEWLRERLNGNCEPFEKWAWRELQESVFKIHVQETEIEGFPYWDAYTEATDQFWLDESLAESSLPLDGDVALFIPRTSESPSLEIVVRT